MYGKTKKAWRWFYRRLSKEKSTDIILPQCLSYLESPEVESALLIFTHGALRPFVRTSPVMRSRALANQDYVIDAQIYTSKENNSVITFLELNIA